MLILAMWSQTSHNCFPLFYEIENCLIQTLSFRDNVHSHFCHAKQPMVISFSTPFPHQNCQISWGGKIFWNLDPWYIVGLIFEGDSTGLGGPSLPMTSFPLRGRIGLNQLLNNVRVNRNTKFKRLELLPLESVFQIQSKNPTPPTDNGHCSTPPPPAICMAMVRMGFLPFGQFQATIVSFWSWHEDLILTGKSLNYAGIAFIQVAQRWLNRF